MPHSRGDYKSDQKPVFHFRLASACVSDEVRWAKCFDDILVGLNVGAFQEVYAEWYRFEHLHLTINSPNFKQRD
jgi:hypothetical protein